MGATPEGPCGDREALEAVPVPGCGLSSVWVDRTAGGIPADIQGPEALRERGRSIPMAIRIRVRNFLLSRRGMNPTRIVAASFGCIILLGALLLTLPLASRSGASAGFFDVLVHRHLRHLRDGPHHRGHLDPVEPVRSGRAAGADPAGRPGIYDGHHHGVLCPAPADRAFRAAHYGLYLQSQ